MMPAARPAGAATAGRGPEPQPALAPGQAALLTVPAPLAPAWAAIPEDADEAVLLAPESGPIRAGWQVARLAEASGPDRFEALDRGAQEILRRLPPVEGEGPAPVLFVGFAFESEVDPTWAPYGAARAVLPRFTYVREADRAWLQVLVDPESDLEGLRAELSAARARLERPRRPDAPRLRVADAGAVEPWRAAIEDAQAAMAEGDLRKVVLSRRIGLTAEASAGPRAVAAAVLGADRPGTRFVFATGGSVFFGITPERLVRVRGDQANTEALAGSRPLGEDPHTLLDDPKEREEHACVVEHVRARLAIWCDEIEAPEQPELLRLGYVSHLHTPMRGRLTRPSSVLQLAQSLHPTPAVGGVPLGTARRHIEAAETGPRGWYTGGVGYLEQGTDGELWVALRSARLDGLEGRAFVGAGIVAGSDPAHEWAETEAKAQAVLGALGAS